jgi:hypothetical protein
MLSPPRHATMRCAACDRTTRKARRSGQARHARTYHKCRCVHAQGSMPSGAATAPQRTAHSRQHALRENQNSYSPQTHHAARTATAARARSRAEKHRRAARVVWVGRAPPLRPSNAPTCSRRSACAACGAGPTLSTGNRPRLRQSAPSALCTHRGQATQLRSGCWGGAPQEEVRIGAGGRTRVHQLAVVRVPCGHPHLRCGTVPNRRSQSDLPSAHHVNHTKPTHARACARTCGFVHKMVTPTLPAAVRRIARGCAAFHTARRLPYYGAMAHSLLMGLPARLEHQCGTAQPDHRDRACRAACDYPRVSSFRRTPRSLRAASSAVRGGSKFEAGDSRPPPMCFTREPSYNVDYAGKGRETP